jgi:hypothetical protein
MRKTIAIAILTLAAGCSSSSTNPSGGGGAGGGGAGGGAAGGKTGNSDGAVTYTLIMENYLSWCTVTEQGTDEGGTASVTMTFPAGTVVNLKGDTVSAASFFWAYWFGTDGDTTSAHDTNMTTTVTMTKNKTVQACCPVVGTPPTCPPPT